MDWSRFSTPSRVRSPVRWGVTASSTGGFWACRSPRRMFLTLILIPYASLSLAFGLVPGAGPPLDDLGLFGGGLDADGKAVAPGQQQPVAARTGQQPALQLRRQVEGFANGADGGGVLLEQQLEGGVLEQGATAEWPVMAREESSESRSCTSWVMNCNPSRCLRARFATLTMKAAPSGCCMMLHTSSTTSSRGRGSWAAAAHTVSVQTIAAAGLSSGSRRCRSKTVTRASWVSRSSPSSERRCRRLPVAKGRSRWAIARPELDSGSPPPCCSRKA